ncbi:MAG: DUF4870 domain-containing protein [Planctomycetota bacterium]|nr:DUF4870 domain-containing protein [Planctomycetota bacterium]MCZ6542179.1 DUF4870 domain-containing protein [Planctomycetota bacterium]MCZ6612920.1 DUF4870 domain-containing protein [Planctomycetota bacterium]MCZ6734302.1 DUF4870 domain-containing protein [Planctomycetota bacterium]MCZ6851278.1 DUF4870 domain-containing protein [Planctomycetota bacterium]
MSIAMPAAEESRVRIEPPTLDRTGRIRAEGLADTERNFAIATHLSLLAAVILGPLVIALPLIIWLARKDQSDFNNDHGREVTNVAITGLLASFFLVWIPILGWGALAIWCVVIFINLIRGAVAAGNGEYFRYPMTIRFLS